LTARGDGKGQPRPWRPGGPPRSPSELFSLLPKDTARTWTALAPHLPSELYLGGGTALAVHLHHRESRDLDFFYHHGAVDLKNLERALGEAGIFAAQHRSDGTLRGLFGSTRIEFFHADEVEPQQLLEEPQSFAGVAIAGIKDLMAMKMKVVRERGELRDYFDIKTIEEQTGLQVEDGLALYAQRYRLGPADEAVAQVVQSLGYLDDVEDDHALPLTKDELAAWWRARQVRLVRHLARNPLR